jgi:predicted kinase
VLIVMAGLPGSGKSAVADGVGGALNVPVVSVDPIEAAMYRAGIDRAQPTGLAAYVVAEAIARGILALGQSVIVDAVNAVEPARQMWRDLAASQRVVLRWIEVMCSDPDVHRRRLESRSRGDGALSEPTWEDVQTRRGEYALWTEDRLTLDTTGELVDNVAMVVRHVRDAAIRPRTHP